MAPRPWKPSPRLSPPSLRPALAPPWPATPRTAVLWLPKATDGTSGLKTLAAPQPAQSSSSNGATVASQAQDSSYMDSESDGWHLGLENPRRASAGPAFVQQWRLRGQPSRGQQLSGFRKRRMAPQAWPSPRPSRPSLRLAMVPQWPARPRTAVIWLPKATDGTSALKIENPRRASAGPVFVQQWRHSGQPSPGQQLYGFRKRRMAPRAWQPPWFQPKRKGSERSLLFFFISDRRFR